MNGSNEWNLRSKADFEYDHDGNVILTTSYSWRLADKVWYISNKSHYYYSLHDLTNNSDIKETPQVKLYPNPAHEAFTLEVNDPSVSQCQIFNSGGQLIKSLPVQIGANAFNISNLQKGLYLVKIKTEKGIIISKMVKN